MSAAQVYGLGVGPGDPELLTLKALRLLRTAPAPLRSVPPAKGAPVPDYGIGRKLTVGERRAAFATYGWISCCAAQAIVASRIAACRAQSSSWKKQ